MCELLEKGKDGALLLVCDTERKYELVSAYKYNEKRNTWCQGHYFTLWNGEITEENKNKLYEKAKKHFESNYL